MHFTPHSTDTSLCCQRGGGGRGEFPLVVTLNLSLAMCLYMSELIEFPRSSLDTFQAGLYYLWLVPLPTDMSAVYCLASLWMCFASSSRDSPGTNYGPWEPLPETSDADKLRVKLHTKVHCRDSVSLPLSVGSWNPRLPLCFQFSRNDLTDTFFPPRFKGLFDAVCLCQLYGFGKVFRHFVTTLLQVRVFSDIILLLLVAVPKKKWDAWKKWLDGEVLEENPGSWMEETECLAFLGTGSLTETGLQGRCTMQTTTGLVLLQLYITFGLLGSWELCTGLSGIIQWAF